MVGDWADPGRVAEYLSRDIPHRDIAEGLLRDSLPRLVERVLDLGTGDGRLLALVRARYPGVQGVGVDSSPPMLARAAERFGEDATVELSLHDDLRKQSLFGEVYALVRPGGVFVNLDLVASATREQHERFRRAIGRENDDPADRLADLCAQLSWLRSAGFHTVDCPFKWMELALVVAVRPTGCGGVDPSQSNT